MIRCTCGFVRILDDDNTLSATIGKQVLNLLEEDFDERITCIQCRIRIQRNIKNPQKRVAYSGKHVRVSRTGGAAVTKICKKDGGRCNPKHQTGALFAYTPISGHSNGASKRKFSIYR